MLRAPCGLALAVAVWLFASAHGARLLSDPHAHAQLHDALAPNALNALPVANSNVASTPHSASAVASASSAPASAAPAAPAPASAPAPSTVTSRSDEFEGDDDGDAPTSIPPGATSTPTIFARCTSAQLEFSPWAPSWRIAPFELHFVGDADHISSTFAGANRFWSLTGVRLFSTTSSATRSTGLANQRVVVPNGSALASSWRLTLTETVGSTRLTYPPGVEMSGVGSISLAPTTGKPTSVEINGTFMQGSRRMPLNAPMTGSFRLTAKCA